MKPVLLFAKRGDTPAHSYKQFLANWLKKKQWPIIDVTGSEGRIPTKKIKSVQLGITFGGDGTFLTLVRRLEKKDLFPIMGVNLGTLGFITEFGKDEMVPFVEAALSNNFVEESRGLLKVELRRKNGTIVSQEVFNDVVLSKDTRTPMFKLEVRIDGETISRVRSDGYIICTSTGSTGYSLAAGGGILHPALNALSLIPICPHSLTARQIVLPEFCRIEISVLEPSGNSFLVCDGSPSAKLSVGDTVQVTSSKTQLRLIRSPGQKWTQALRTKLGMQ